MGNCVRKNNQISAAQDHENEEEGTKVEQIMEASSSSLPKLEKARREKSNKRVRFEVQDHRGGKGSGAMRIRLVVTKEELKRMLMNENENENENDAPQTSLEQLLSDMKLREKRAAKIEEKEHGGLNSWRPALESIPEDHSFKI